MTTLQAMFKRTDTALYMKVAVLKRSSQYIIREHVSVCKSEHDLRVQCFNAIDCSVESCWNTIARAIICLPL